MRMCNRTSKCILRRKSDQWLFESLMCLLGNGWVWIWLGWSTPDADEFCNNLTMSTIGISSSVTWCSFVIWALSYDWGGNKHLFSLCPSAPHLSQALGIQEYSTSTKQILPCLSSSAMSFGNGLSNSTSTSILASPMLIGSRRGLCVSIGSPKPDAMWLIPSLEKQEFGIFLSVTHTGKVDISGVLNESTWFHGATKSRQSSTCHNHQHATRLFE